MFYKKIIPKMHKTTNKVLFESAAASCALLDTFLINFPKITAEIAINGTIASIIKDSFHDINPINVIPNTIVNICLRNSASVVLNVSFNKTISEEILLCKMPTLFLS